MMTMEADEDEHSIEMQLPYIAKVIGTIGCGQGGEVGVGVTELHRSSLSVYCLHHVQHVTS